MNSLCKLCRRNFITLKSSRPLSRNYSENTLDNHVYDRVIPWKSNRELADYLCENIVYDSEGLIVLNKPYGVSFSKDGLNWQNIAERSKGFKPVIKHRVPKVANPDDVLETNRGFIRDDVINLKAALPFIEDKINGGQPLRVVRVPEKYTSGVSLLARHEKLELKIKKCLARSKALREPVDSYLAIVTGEPIIKRLENFTIGVKLEFSENKKQKKPALTKTYSKNELQRSLVKATTVHSNLLSMGVDEDSGDALASLVQLETGIKRWHFVRLFLATHLLAPALGDHLFGARVKKVMGEMLLVDQWSQAAATGKQKLDRRLLDRLDLTEGSEMYIPTMIHHSSVILEGFQGKKTDSQFTLQAKPPQHFLWTAERLALEVPRCDPDEQVQEASIIQ
ncbi:mitochondrial mRNA pseudouridine synthase RPUSD3 [Nilaparvata lugens]|uniref:mitochondrial mRNA pseudouridine synthase RPUSD3 n=1 Tax=Nilaparvata lugens TaxID=108931 RepID=UPI00193E9B1A|nr:mitochondrial mRNA pseudouridine synthase RPUSD3 [Nilaparvata lugens]